MGGGARSAPFGVLMSPKRKGAAHARARARTRGQNPLVVNIDFQPMGLKSHRKEGGFLGLKFKI
jgi:hypothetical protein